MAKKFKKNKQKTDWLQCQLFCRTAKLSVKQILKRWRPAFFYLRFEKERYSSRLILCAQKIFTLITKPEVIDMTSSGIDGVDGDSENSLDYQDGDVVLNIEDEELVNDILMNLEILKARGQAEELDNDPSGLAKNDFGGF